MTNPGEFQIELKTSDAAVRSAKFEIHVAEMIFRANDVGQQFVALQLPIITKLSHEPNRNSSHRHFHRNTRIHKRQRASTNARH